MSTCIFTEENKMSLFWLLAYNREICCLKKKIVFSRIDLHRQLIKILQQKTLFSSQVMIFTGQLLWSVSTYRYKHQMIQKRLESCTSNLKTIHNYSLHLFYSSGL